MSAARQAIRPPSQPALPRPEIPPPARTPSVAPRQGRVTSPDAAPAGAKTVRPGARLGALLSVMDLGAFVALWMQRGTAPRVFAASRINGAWRVYAPRSGR